MKEYIERMFREGKLTEKAVKKAVEKKFITKEDCDCILMIRKGDDGQ